MKVTSLLFSILFVLFSSATQAAEPKAGVDYTLYAPAQPVDAAAGKIEVTEFFAYSCSHCADIDPLIENWLKSAPKDVSLRRIPVMFRPQLLPGVKLYYSLEAMNLLDKLHGAVFNALHVQHINLLDEKTLFDWIASKGIDTAEFSAVYRSFSVQSKVQRADQIAKTHGIPGTPALVVNGKYLVSAADHAQQLKVVDYLIAKERAAKKK